MKNYFGKNIKAIHLPTEALKINFENNHSLETNAFCYNILKTPNENQFRVHPDDINKIIQQNNYTNLNMQTVNSQLNRIEDSIEKIQMISKEKTPTIEKLKLEPVLMKPFIEISEGFKQSKNEKNKEIIDALTEKLER